MISLKYFQRDDLRYILQHFEDFENPDGITRDRSTLNDELDEVVSVINTMQPEAKKSATNAGLCQFTLFDSSKFIEPVLSKRTDDALLIRSSFNARQDPLAILPRNGLPDKDSKRGYSISFGVNNGIDSLPGPGKEKIQDGLSLDERASFSTAIAYYTVRNQNQVLVNTEGKIATITTALSAARTEENNAFR